MSFLDNVFKMDRATANGKLVSGYGPLSFILGNTESTRANYKTSLTISAFYNGVNIISDDIAKLPKNIFEKEGKNRNIVEDHPANYLLSVAPNDLMTSYDFWKIMVISAILKGNGFASIVRNEQSAKEESYIFLKHDDVKVYKQDNKLFYEYKGDVFSSEDILHLKGFSLDGLVGIGVVSFAAYNLGIILDSQSYAAEIYKDRGLGYGVIESEKDVIAENKKAIEEGFAAKMASKSKFKVPMLDSGMKYKSIAITPAEAQFLETNKNGVLEVCRWLNLAPHKLKDLSAGTYSNVYQQSIEHVGDSIIPWVTKIELEVTRKTFSKNSKMYFKMNTNALLRGDLSAKKDYYTAGIYSGFFTRNEVRALEDLNPIEGLDEPLQPVNMQAVSMALELVKNQNNNNDGK